MVRAALILMLSTLPAQALTLGELAGQWRGEGVFETQGEPAQRLRCQMRGVARADGVALTGRCATAQGGQSFAWDLSARDGIVTAQDRSPVTDDSPAPPPAEGRIGPEGMHFDTPGGGRFDLRREGHALMLRLTGQDGGRPVRAEARLDTAD